MSQPKTKSAGRAIAAAVVLGALLAGCSDIYYDRRETISLGAEDAVASNMAEEMVDPWPRYSNNNNLAFNGERMQRAGDELAVIVVRQNYRQRHRRRWFAHRLRRRQHGLV